MKTVDVIIDSSHLGQIVKWASLETFGRYLLFLRFQKWVFFNISLKIEQQRLKNYVWVEHFYIFFPNETVTGACSVFSIFIGRNAWLTTCVVFPTGLFMSRKMVLCVSEDLRCFFCSSLISIDKSECVAKFNFSSNLLFCKVVALSTIGLQKLVKLK